MFGRDLLAPLAFCDKPSRELQFQIVGNNQVTEHLSNVKFRHNRKQEKLKKKKGT